MNEFIVSVHKIEWEKIMSNIINVSAGSQREYTLGQNEKKSSVFTGNLSLKQRDKDEIIGYKKGLAQKQAMKLIGDAWDKDQKSSEKITEFEHTKVEKQSEFHELGNIIKTMEDNKVPLQEEYGVDKDSQEQKDLDILQKFQNYQGGLKDNKFTKEEIGRLHELQNMERTEYQKEVLALNSSTAELKSKMESLTNEIGNLNHAIINGKINQLQSQEMLDAQDAADSIMEATNEEILGILVQEGVDKVEEDREEDEKVAEEAAKKQEEQEERIDKSSENDANNNMQSEIIKNATESNRLDRNITTQKQTASTVEDAQKSIQKILQDNNLIEEDLKGIKIDFNR